MPTRYTILLTAIIVVKKYSFDNHLRTFLLVQEIIVLNMDFGADGKLAKKIQDKFKAMYPDISLFLVSIDDDGEK